MENISSYLILPLAIEKPLSEREKKWILQREIFSLIEQEDIKKLNWKRYIAFLKRYRVSEREIGRDMAVKMWKKCRDKEYKQIRKLSSKSFGFFTNHVRSEDLFALKSKAQDMLNRSESPTCYIYSLSKVL